MAEQTPPRRKGWTQTSVWFPTPILQDVRKIADQEDRSVNAQIIRFLRECADTYWQQHGRSTDSS